MSNQISFHRMLSAANTIIALKKKYCGYNPRTVLSEEDDILWEDCLNIRDEELLNDDPKHKYFGVNMSLEEIRAVCLGQIAIEENN